MFKRIGLFIALTLASIGQMYSQAKPQFITVYSDDFSGNHYDFGVGQYDNTYLLETGYPTIGSVKVPTGMQVRLYLQDNFKGEPVVLQGDARLDYLKSRGFQDVTNNLSMIVSLAPAPDPAMAASMVTIYRDNFAGSSQTLKPGRYEPSDLTIGNDQLSSLRIPAGMKVTLYENQGMEGKKLELTKDTPAEVLVSKGFNDVTSSIAVEMIPDPAVVPAVVSVPTPAVIPAVAPAVVVVPTVAPTPELKGPSITFYNGGFDGRPSRLAVGNYQLLQDLQMNEGQPFAFRIPWGMRVTLHDAESYAGRPGKKITFTEDTGFSTIADSGFRNITSWVVVSEIPASEVRVTLYRDDFVGPSGSLAAGKYTFTELGVGNDALSSIRIPRGLRVTLYENANFDGRSAVLMADADEKFFIANQFNDLTSSIVIERLPVEDLQVTIYRDNFSGTAKSFMPGRYDAFDLRDEEDKLSSVRIPAGMKVTLFENDNFKGRTLALTRDAGGDYILANRFNDITSSLIVEDAFVPVVTPPAPVVKAEAVVVPVVVAKSAEPLVVPVVVPAVVTPAVAVTPAIDCTMTAAKFDEAVNAVKAESFSAEKLSVAQLTTKNKCLSLDQVRTMGKLLTWDDSIMPFVKGSYELCTNKDSFYTLADIFTYSTSKSDLLEFLKNK